VAYCRRGRPPGNEGPLTWLEQTEAEHNLLDESVSPRIAYLRRETVLSS
jgi:hypothetical protein